MQICPEITPTTWKRPAKKTLKIAELAEFTEYWPNFQTEFTEFLIHLFHASGKAFEDSEKFTHDETYAKMLVLTCGF